MPSSGALPSMDGAYDVAAAFRTAVRPRCATCHLIERSDADAVVADAMTCRQVHCPSGAFKMSIDDQLVLGAARDGSHLDAVPYVTEQQDAA